MSLTASMTEIPDVTPEHMNKLGIKWKTAEMDLVSFPQNVCQERILILLKQNGETITHLTQTDRGYYGENSHGQEKPNAPSGRACQPYQHRTTTGRTR